MTEQGAVPKKLTRGAAVADQTAYLLVKEHGFAAPVVVAGQIGDLVHGGDMEGARDLMRLLRNINNVLSRRVD